MVDLIYILSFYQPIAECVQFWLGGSYLSTELRLTCKALSKVIQKPEPKMDANTMMIIGTKKGSKDLCQLALKHGASIRAMWLYGLHYNQTNICQYVAEIDPIQCDWGLALKYAVYHNSCISLFGLVLKYGETELLTKSLFYAAESGNVEMCEMTKEYGFKNFDIMLEGAIYGEQYHIFLLSYEMGG